MDTKGIEMLYNTRIVDIITGDIVEKTTHDDFPSINTAKTSSLLDYRVYYIPDGLYRLEVLNRKERVVDTVEFTIKRLEDDYGDKDVPTVYYHTGWIYPEKHVPLTNNLTNELGNRAEMNTPTKSNSTSVGNVIRTPAGPATEEAKKAKRLAAAAKGRATRAANLAAKKALGKQDGIQDGPVSSAVASNISSVETVSIEPTPVESSPVESTPVESTPFNDAVLLWKHAVDKAAMAEKLWVEAKELALKAKEIMANVSPQKMVPKVPTPSDVVMHTVTKIAPVENSLNSIHHEIEEEFSDIYKFSLALDAALKGKANCFIYSVYNELHKKYDWSKAVFEKVVMKLVTMKKVHLHATKSPSPLEYYIVKDGKTFAFISKL
jgi:hypothetical protein